MDKKLLDKIKMELPAGAITEIAEKSGKSKATVVKFFNGQSCNMKVMAAVTEVYGNYKKVMTELSAMAAM